MSHFNTEDHSYAHAMKRPDLSKDFLANQAKIITERINKYLNSKRIADELQSAGNVSIYILHKQKNVLPNLEKALSRLHDGTYGICSVCGHPIATKRLIVVPGADYCVLCEKI